MEQPQQASVLHLRQSAEEAQCWDPETIFSFFQRLCHNPRENQEAVQRFTSVRQRDEESLVAYLARFERLTYEANATTWPDVTRVTTLHRGLRTTLRQTLENSNDALFDLPYDNYIKLVQRTNRYNQPVSDQKRTQNPALNPAKNPALKNHPDTMDITPVQLASVHTEAPPASPTLTASSGSSLHSSASNRRTFRLDHDLCLYCGSDEHWISQCSTAKPDKPRTKTTARSVTMSARFGQQPTP